MDEECEVRAIWKVAVNGKFLLDQALNRLSQLQLEIHAIGNGSGSLNFSDDAREKLEWMNASLDQIRSGLDKILVIDNS